MAERLSGLTYSQQFSEGSGYRQSQSQHPGGSHFNPQKISLDIQSPEELAAVNEFLLTLGKNITTSQPSTRGVGSSSSSQLTSDYSMQQHTPTPDYFDPVSLSQLGLANMPGLSNVPSPASVTSSISNLSNYTAGSYNNYSPGSQQRQPNSSVRGLYPGFDEQPARLSRVSAANAPGSYLQTISIAPDSHSHPPPPTSASQAGSTPTRAYHDHGRSSSNASSYNLTPPHSGSGTRSPSPFSASASHQGPHLPTVQIPAYPQHQPRSSPNSAGSHPPPSSTGSLGALPDGVENFDFLQRGGIAGLEQPTLGPYEVLGAHTRRTVVPLKKSPLLHDVDDEMGEREKREKSTTKVILPPLGPVEPKIREPIQRGPPARLASSSLSLASSSRPPSSSASSEGEKKGQLYPLFCPDDSEFKLPPLVESSRASSSSPSPSPVPHNLPSSRYRQSAVRSSPLRPRSRSPSSDDDDDDEIDTQRVEMRMEDRVKSTKRSLTLPSIRSLTALAKSEQDRNDITQGVEDIRIDNPSSEPGPSLAATVTADDRRRHAEFVRDLLITINRDYRARFGTPPPSVPVQTERKMAGRDSDVQMTAAA